MEERDKRTRVFEAMDAALTNGYHHLIFYAPPELVAEDIASYDALLEGHEPAGLVPFVLEWRQSRQ